MILALLTAVSLWLSAGTLAVTRGDTHRIAALPSLWILGFLVIATLAAARIVKLRAEESWPLAISLLLWLPFLPGPAAFLMWQGPIEGLVWLAVIGGLVAVRRPPMPQPFTDPRMAPAIAGVLLAACALVAFSQVRGVVPGGDEPHYLAATQSLLHDADLRVANNYAQGEYLDYFPGRLEPHFLKRAESGEIYSIHAPGVSVIVLPAFALFGYLGAVLTIVLIGAMTAAVCWRIAWRISGSAGAAWVAVIAVFGSAPYFLHTFTIYPEIIGAFVVMLSVSFLLDLSEAHEPSQRRVIAVGSALALLPWLHTRFAVIAGLFGIITVLRLAARRQALSAIATFLAPPAVAGLAWFAYFWLIWGTPSPTAPYGADTSTSPSYILRGLIGLLLDQQYGVLTTAPIYLVAITGIGELFRRRPRLTIELLLVVIVYALTVASYQMWWAGSAAPARFVISILPLSVLPIAMAVGALLAARDPSRRPLLWGCLLLLMISVALLVPRVAVESGRFIFNNRAPFDATLEWLSQIVDLPAALPSVHRDGGWTAVRDGGVWIALLVAAAMLTTRYARTIARQWMMTTFACAIAVMIATTVVWRLHGASGVTPERSKLAALAHYRPAWQRVLADVSTMRGLPEPGFFDALALEISSTQVRLNRVPAGDYAMRVTSAALAPGTLTMFVGRNDPPIESPLLDDLREGRSSYRLRLPAPVQSLNLTTKANVNAGSTWLTLRPISVRVTASDRNALRATRYGHARAFFLDEWAYLEPDGFWTRANGTAQVVIDSDDGVRSSGLPISITAGAVATTIELAIGDWRESWSLAAGQRQDVMLPGSESGTWPLRIRSGAGFRPSQRDPGNRDVRELAAWIAIH